MSKEYIPQIVKDTTDYLGKKRPDKLIDPNNFAINIFKLIVKQLRGKEEAERIHDALSLLDELKIPIGSVMRQRRIFIEKNKVDLKKIREALKKKEKQVREEMLNA